MAFSSLINGEWSWLLTKWVILQVPSIDHMCHSQKSLYWGWFIPPLMRNPFNEYMKPYYWVDDHPLLKKKTYVWLHRFCCSSRLGRCNGTLLHTRVLWWGMPWMKKFAVEVGGLEPGHGCFVYIYIYIYISTSLYTQLDMYIRIFIIYISYIYIHTYLTTI